MRKIISSLKIKIDQTIINVFHLDPKFLIQSAFWVNFQLIALKIIKLVYVILLTKILSVSLYGEFSYALSILSALSIFSLSGFGQTVVKALAQKKYGTYKKWRSLGFYWSIIGSIGAFLYIYFRGYEKLNFWIILILIMAPIYYLFSKWDTLLFGLVKFKERARYQTIKTLMLSGLIIISASINEQPIKSILLTYFLVSIIIDLLITKKTNIYLKNNQVANNWKSSGYKLSVNALFETVYGTLDKLLLYNLLGPQFLAYYSVAIYIPENTKIIISNNLKMYYPKILKSTSGSVDTKLRNSKKLLLILPLLITLVLLISTPVLIKVFFGSKYTESIKYALFYTLITPLHFYFILLHSVLIKEQKESHVVYASIVAGIINILGYVILIPRFGIWGAASSSLLYYIVKVIYYLFVYKKVYGKKQVN